MEMSKPVKLMVVQLVELNGLWFIDSAGVWFVALWHVKYCRGVVCS